MRPSTKRLLMSSVAPYGDAMLALDFVGSRSAGTPYYMLNGVRYPSVTAVPGWTYTGGTAAGTGSYAPKADGSLQFFPSVTNLLLQSQTLDNASWIKTSITVSANATTAPDGTTTADLVTTTATSGTSFYNDTAGISPASAYTLSFYAKANSGNDFIAAILFTPTGTNGARVWCNTTTGAVSGAVLINSATGLSSGSQSIGNGWWRFWVTVTPNGAGTTLRAELDQSTASGSYTSASGGSNYIWGAQLELGSTASTYIPTTTAAVTVAPPRITDAGYLAEEARTNLLLRSQEFDNATWSKSNVTVTANQATAPDGTLTADLVVNTPSVSSFLAQTSPTMANSTTYTKTVYVALAPGNTAPTFVSTVNKGAGELATNFNLSTLAITGTDSATSSLVAVANGFYRVTHVFTTAASGTPNWGVFYLGNYGATASAANFYIWQADLQAGSFATSPIPTTSVAVTRAADVGYISGLTVPSAGTLVSRFVPTKSTGGSVNEYLTSLSNGTSANRVLLYRSPGSPDISALLTSGGTGYGPIAATGPAANVIGNSAVSYQIGTLVTASQGALSSAASPASVPSMDRLTVGMSIFSDSFFNAPIRRIVIYPRAMSNAELQAITTAGAY